MRYLAAGILILFFAGVMYALLSGNERATTGEPQKLPSTEISTQDSNLLGCLQKDGHFKIMLAALKGSNLEKTLSSKGPYTFFAPTDEAFEHVPRLAELIDSPERFQSVMEHHLLESVPMDVCALFKAQELHPKTGEPLKMTCNGRLFQVDDAKIVLADIKASNGYLHGIDRVLMQENDSMLRDAGATIERGLKKGKEKVEETIRDLRKEDAKNANVKTNGEN